MSIRITWNNPNTVYDTINVYRTTMPIDYTNKPSSPTAVVPSGNTYLDESAVQDTYYYYTVGVVRGTDEILNFSTLTYQLTYSGPGPASLQCGDLRLGYFGPCDPAIMPSAQEFAQLYGFTPLSAGTLIWHKYIFKGKILFYPSTSLASVAPGYSTLYNKGLIYGVDGPGPAGLVAAGYPAVNQQTIYSLGNDDFIVRLPKGTTNDANIAPTEAAVSELSEIYLLLYSQRSVTSPNNTYPVLGDAMAGTWPTPYSGTLLMELAAPAFTTGLSISTAGVAQPTVLGTAAFYWRPVLELVT